MNEKFNRRDLIKTASTAAIASVLAVSTIKAADPNTPADKIKKPELPQVPLRKLGRAKISVPMLSLGGLNDFTRAQMLLQKAYEWGVKYWDTANSYNNGQSELGIGKYLRRKPKIREELFIVTKASGAGNVNEIEKKLQLSLERMSIKYIDLYYGVHGLNDPAQLTDELKAWAADAKKRGLIKYFGFSTHSNMADCLLKASELDWIDGVMTTYNYQLLDDEKMQKAVQKCHDAGIAIIAMKTQAKGTKDELDYKMVDHFEQKGYTAEQAKVKAIWQDETITAVCSQMPNISILTSNIAAALDKTKLTPEDTKVLKDDAVSNSSLCCVGCERICADACPQMPQVRDVMRSLMYANCYGNHKKALGTFAKIPAWSKANIMTADYSLAQSRCPKNLPIADLMKEAAEKFA